MIFGIYCEVQIETLRQIKLKYVEDYESLVQFLSDFHLLTGANKPSILAIDSLDYFLENRNLQPCTKKMRMHFILSLAADAHRYLAPQKSFAANSLIIAYRCAPNQNENAQD